MVKLLRVKIAIKVSVRIVNTLFPLYIYLFSIKIVIARANRYRYTFSILTYFYFQKVGRHFWQANAIVSRWEEKGEIRSASKNSSRAYIAKFNIYPKEESRDENVPSKMTKNVVWGYNPPRSNGNIQVILSFSFFAFAHFAFPS